MEERIRRLIDTLNAASAAYYGGKSEIMTDHEWDEAFDELARLENETGIRFPDSPTQRVSEDVIPGQEEPHEYPALSLQKTKSPADLVRWAGGKSVWVSWKEDGLTLVATYERGRLIRLLTRGNGVVGTNLTHLAPCIAGIPDTVPENGKLVIRGEAVISYADFDAFLLESGEDYQNPRNLASGSLSLKDPAEVRRRRIRFIPFTLVHTDRNIISWGERLDLLDSLGFTTVEREKVDDPEALERTVKKWSDRAEKGLSPFPVDGLVITYDDTVYAEGGTVTGHHRTRGGIAFKWADESADTVLRQVEWSCAASAITPVALFDPVRLEGTTVSRATLHNVSECRRLGLGGAGTRIRVIKANKIIPKVVAVLGAEGVFSVPSSCPVCGSATVLSMSASGAETLRCTFEGCPGKKIRKLTRFVSKSGMDIDGLSVQTLVRLINLGWVREYRDIYTLSGHASEMAVLDGFGEKSVSNLLSAIDKSREVSADKLLFALNIPLCGSEVARLLLKHYTLEGLIAAASEAEDSSVFTGIDGIGPEKSASMVTWMKDEENRRSLLDLLKELKVTETEKTPSGEKCSGLTFVITGDVSVFRNRAEMKKYIESQGGKVTGSVTSKTSFLISNDAASGSEKSRKAASLGVKVISEDEFISSYGKP
ncbi:MAG: NAD-dependent DNA ligase LigA [Clostridia bacterium]|nr:NAD-dependent DNA ligase LigA [Clostridia bacterium]